MKKALFFVSIALCSLMNAQGRRANQYAISANYGYLLNQEDAKDKFMAKLGVSKVIGDNGFLAKAEGFYQKSEVTYIDKIKLPYEKYGLNLMAGYSYEGLAPVFFNAYLGGYAGMEKVNNGNSKDPYYNAEIPAKLNELTYGAVGSAEIEVFIARRFALTADYTQFYDLKSKFSKTNYAIFGGLKFYLN